MIALSCNAEGCPAGVEAFEGNTAGPKTLSGRIQRIRERFQPKRVVRAGDPGMRTAARIDRELRPNGPDWITALRSPAIRASMEEGTIQTSLFDERDLAEITSPACSGERLMACRNPLPADERARKRKERLVATGRGLDLIVLATQRSQNRLRGKDRIASPAGRVLHRHKMGRYLRLHITEDSFRYEPDEESIAAEAALDGIHVVRTSLPARTPDAHRTVGASEGSAMAKRAFRSLETVDLRAGPIRHHLEDRGRTHVLPCMPAYCVQWHMRQALAPILLGDADRPAGQVRRTSAAARARRPARAEPKAATRQTPDGRPVHSFQTLLADLATLTRNRVRFQRADDATVTVYAQVTAWQQRALRLLQVPVNLQAGRERTIFRKSSRIRRLRHPCFGASPSVAVSPGGKKSRIPASCHS